MLDYYYFITPKSVISSHNLQKLVQLLCSPTSHSNICYSVTLPPIACQKIIICPLKINTSCLEKHLKNVCSDKI